jgi:(E)-4-hydroxy-3-methyl-but-2-enyl pyrophosphate reductase
MKVFLAETAGFCWGVQRAVEKARQLASGDQVPVYTDGPLIHNEEMMQALHRDGILETDTPERIGSHTLIIRAHGIPPSRRAELRSLPVRLVDATCPDVARIQGTIRKHARRGYAIVIFGDKGHAEVTGLLGHAEGHGYVVESIQDVGTLPAIENVCLVSQSTQFPFAFERIAKAIRKRFPRALVIDTICKSTRSRQSEVLRLAKRVEAFVVVGGAHSANTLRLVDLATSLHPTYHIQHSDQIDDEWFQGLQCVGLTAGASTPHFIIEAVRKRIENIGQHPSPKAPTA